MFADDTAIITQNKIFSVVISNLQHYVSMLELWLTDWKIKVNASKSACPIFTRRNQLPVGLTPSQFLANPSPGKSRLAVRHKVLLFNTIVAAVAEWYRYQIVACLFTSSNPVPLKTRRVGQRCTLNLSRAEMSSRWCGVVVRRGGANSAVDAAASPAADILGHKFRLFVKDREIGCQFLVDSGEDVSILPWTKKKGECQASQYKLYTANGTEIPTYGLKILTLDLGLRRPFQWPFIIAKVKRGIIGADFLKKFQLLIDLHNRKLIDGVTNLSIKGEVATIQENNDLSTVNRDSMYFNLLNSYPDLTKPNLVNRVVKHHILTTGQPVYSKARQLAPDKLKLAKQEFQFMLDNDIIRPSKSQWASPLHLVNKKDGTLRPCGDYRRLNAQTIPDRYPIPKIEDFNHILKDKKIFSKR
ncbi:transposon Ty3-G Gag-Pol polyprotein [Trichonephila clavipes]|nr:transposon Ty3-G Gag-Pol polyprotein [Trichonephila clavipes]